MLKRLMIDLMTRKASRLASTDGGQGVSGARNDPSHPSAQVAPRKSSITLPLTPVSPPDDLRRRDWPLKSVTLIIPSVARRAPYLRSALEHLRRCGIETPVLISDHSESVERHVIESLAGEYRDLDLVILHHSPALHFLERLNACAAHAVTKYVVVHADDDFMLPDALIECIRYLDEHADHVACQGRSFFLHIEPPNLCIPSAQRSMSRQESSVEKRIAEHCRNFTPTLYAVVRREAFIRANESALTFTDNVIFWQYLSSCLLLALGKLRTLDALYYLRLDNPRGWRATLVREADPTHWPYLIVAPDFSAELLRFKSGLASILAPMAPQDRALLVDKCCLGLVRRVFAATTTHEPFELELLQRLSSAGSREMEVVRYCGALSIVALQGAHE